MDLWITQRLLANFHYTTSFHFSFRVSGLLVWGRTHWPKYNALVGGSTELWTFIQWQYFPRPLRWLSLTAEMENPMCHSHTARVIGCLISWTGSCLRVGSPEIPFFAQSFTWSLSQKNSVSIVWPSFHYVLTPKCLSVESTGFEVGDLHPWHMTSSPLSVFIRGESIHWKTVISCIIKRTYTHFTELTETHCSATSSVMHYCAP